MQERGEAMGALREEKRDNGGGVNETPPTSPCGLSLVFRYIHKG